MIEIIIKKGNDCAEPAEVHSFTWLDDSERSLGGWEDIMRTVLGALGFHTDSIEEFLGYSKDGFKKE